VAKHGIAFTLPFMLLQYMLQLEVQSPNSGVKVRSPNIQDAIDVFVQQLFFSYLKIQLSYPKSQDASGFFSHHGQKAMEYFVDRLG